MDLISIPEEEWTHSFTLPSHFNVSRTGTLSPATVTGLPLPLREEFQAPTDAFDGKVFVRFPRLDEGQLHVMGPAARLRCQPPLLDATTSFDSFWLPNHCIIGNNSLEKSRIQRTSQRTATTLRGLGSRAVSK